MAKHEPPAGVSIKDPILLKAAQEEFGVGRKWILARVKSGAIRSQKIDHYVVLEYGDVVKLVGPASVRALLERAKRRKKS